MQFLKFRFLKIHESMDDEIWKSKIKKSNREIRWGSSFTKPTNRFKKRSAYDAAYPSFQYLNIQDKRFFLLDLVDFGGFQRSSGVIHYDRPRGGLHDATTSD